MRIRFRKKSGAGASKKRFVARRIYEEERVKKRRWEKRGPRAFRFWRDYVNAMIFGSDDGFWAYGVWGSKFTAEGVGFGLRYARKKANEAIDQIEAAR